MIEYHPKYEEKNLRNGGGGTGVREIILILISIIDNENKMALFELNPFHCLCYFNFEMMQPDHSLVKDLYILYDLAKSNCV